MIGDKIMTEDFKFFKKYIKDKINFLQNNVGAVTWICTVFVTVSTVALKFIIYIYERGAMDYWKIEVSNVSIFGDTTLYSVGFAIISSLIITAITLLPYFIIKSPSKIIVKIMGVVVLYLIFSAFTINLDGMMEVVKSGVQGFIGYLIVNSIFFCICFFPSVIWWMFKRLEDANANKPITVKKLLVIITVWFCFIIGIFYGAGYFGAKIQTEFRFVEDNYAIVYETNEYYYLAKLNDKTKKIDRAEQTILPKENVKYEWKNIEK